MKRCEACGREFEAPRRRFCDDAACRRRRDRLRKRGKIARPRPAGQPSGEVTEATRRELEAAGKLDTSVGQAAMALARQLDDADEDTGSSMAAVAKQLTAHMDEALRGVKVKGDPLDELRARRERRMGRA